MGRPVPHGPKNREDCVEVPKVTGQQGKGSENASKNGHAWQNDAPRSHPVQQVTERRRTNREHDGGDTESQRCRLPGPPEFLRQRLQENPESVNQQRSKADQYARSGGQGDPPSRIGESAFVPPVIVGVTS